MLSIVKPRIKFFLVAIIGFLPTYSVALDVTPIQLRVMQTRIFEKSPAEVATAASESFMDFGFKCYASGYNTSSNTPNSYTCQKTPDFSGSSNGIGVGHLAGAVPIFGGLISLAQTNSRLQEHDEKMSSPSQISYTIKAHKGKSVVRMRVYNMKQNQFTDPDVYRKYFKYIADGIFVEALEITPATMY